MGRTKQLYMDAQVAAAERYMEEHPDADPADAWEAVSDQAWHDMGDALAAKYDQAVSEQKDSER